MSRRGKGPRPPSPLAFVLVWTPLIRGVLVDAGVPLNDVDDLAQDVTFAAWRATQSGRLDSTSPPAVRAWLRVAAARIGGKWAARVRRVVPREDVDVAEDDSDAEAPSIARELVAEMRAATTPARWRCWRALTEGASLKEIAAEEHVPIGTVATRARLARRDFQAAIQRERAREQTPVRRRRKGMLTDAAAFYDALTRTAAVSKHLVALARRRCSKK